jgi:hypothetical protein
MFNRFLARLGVWLVETFGVRKYSTYSVKLGRLDRTKYPKPDIRRERMLKAWDSVVEVEGVWYERR